MDNLYSILIFITSGFICMLGVFVLFLSRIRKRERKLLEQRIARDDYKKKQLMYEITVLRKIQEKSRSPLDDEKVIDVVTEHLNTFIPYSTISSLIFKRDKLVLKTTISEPISQEFLDGVKESMMKSFLTLSDAPLPLTVDEQINGILAADIFKYPLSSFFHVPILVNGKATALVTIASTKPNCYTVEEMTHVYKVTDLASRSLSSLETVIRIEKGKLMAMIGSLADGLFLIDANSQVTVINETAKGFLHILKDNPTILDISSTLPSSFDFGGKIQAALMHNEAVEKTEITIGEKTFQIAITPIQDLSDTTTQGMIGVSVLLHDITFEKSLAKMKEEFTNIMVHELRSPMTSIKSISQLLTISTSLPEEEKKKMLHQIYDQSKKLLDDISLILDTARLEAGLFSIQKAPSDIKSVIQEHIALFTPPAKEKFINLVAEVDPDIPTFSFDPQHIGRVLNNLISNSLKYTPSGGTIRLTAKHTPEEVEISVADTGSGIPKDKQHLLFKRFGQITSAQRHTGTGLGLYFVKGVVEAHKGTVTLNSDEGHGTTISFTLPLELAHNNGLALKPEHLAA